MKRRATVVAGIILSIFLLSYAVRDVSLPELLDQLGEANVWWLLAATAVATFTFVIRAIRWRILLLPAVGPLPLSSSFAAVCIGFMVNNVLPARLGEFARAYSLRRIEPVGMSAALASLVLERLLDALVLVSFLIPAILLGAGDVAVSGTLRDLFTVLVVIVSVGLVSLGVLVRFPSRFLRLAERWSHRLAPERLADRLTGMLASFLAGLGALRHAHVFARALLWSVVVWGWNALSFYLGFVAFDIRGPGIPGALLLQTMIGVAVAIPSTPGFFGPFEAASRVALELYAIEPARIISFAAGYHILTFIPVTVLGIWYMRRLGISRAELGHSDELVHASAAPPGPARTSEARAGGPAPASEGGEGPDGRGAAGATTPPGPEAPPAVRTARGATADEVGSDGAPSVAGRRERSKGPT